MCVGICYSVCFLPLGAIVDAISQLLGFVPLQPFRAYPWQAHVQPGDGHWPTPGMHQVAAPSTALSRGDFCYSNQLSSTHSNYMVGHTALGAWQSHLIPPPSLHGGGGVFCSRFGSI